ncbi:unnamed protein product [Nesidiocoris tenuis]|uniref:Uncharacterized protein n=1 Tax=Nesidiocoris tenuis TaxID=355587 RepID=A0A6H5HWF2_9HEMI|nr:unnamed protein product [Nesidiocoris tenuis]
MSFSNRHSSSWYSLRNQTHMLFHTDHRKSQYLRRVCLLMNTLLHRPVATLMKNIHARRISRISSSTVQIYTRRSKRQAAAEASWTRSSRRRG